MVREIRSRVEVGAGYGWRGRGRVGLKPGRECSTAASGRDSSGLDRPLSH